MIYRFSIDLSQHEFDGGGWLYTELADTSDLYVLQQPGSGSGSAIGHVLRYATRIPALKAFREAADPAARRRNLFAAVLFPIADANPTAGYDELIAESILYDDGFAKIVHANQPVNQDLLQETDKTNPPMKDAGIRLGWDDEQLSIWYNRQLDQKNENGTAVDSPLGVFAYAVDVRKADDTTWHPQNRVMANANILLNGQVAILAAGDDLELGTEVHPVSHGHAAADGFWLPMYYAGWIGKSLAIPDKDAEEISQLPLKQTFHPYRQHPDDRVELLYGNKYHFRVRLLDVSGGGATATDEPLNGGQKPEASLHFKRHTAAGTLHILNVKETFAKQHYETDADGQIIDSPANVSIDTGVLENLLDADQVLRIKRPLLSYPAVAFTGKYAQVTDKLKAILQDLDPAVKSVELGLPDPDVDYFKVKVEVKSLEMDNVGKEPYFLLYEKLFRLDEAPDDYSQTFGLEIVYKDFAQLTYASFDDTGSSRQLVLPTSRNLRISLIPVISQAQAGEGAASHDYADESVYEGKAVLLSAFKAAADERHLLSPINGGFRAFYLQPDHHTEAHTVGQKKQTAIGYQAIPLSIQLPKTSVELARLANQLDLVARNLTLEAPRGYRIQFGCSKEIRHSLAPEASSLTLSENSELFNQWIVAVDFSILRDWAWDALDVRSIHIFRKLKNEKDEKFGDEALAGTVDLIDTANIKSLLDDVQRDHTRFIFLDAIDPKKVNKTFPDEILATYRIQLNFKKGYEHTQLDDDIAATLHLPITIIPRQVPKLVSAGTALSPYTYDEAKYTYTNPRQKFLWLEFEEPPQDPDDAYFVRVLNHAPDPLLCRVDAELLGVDYQDASFTIDDEKIRTIIPGMNNDYVGMGAMQEMIPEDTVDGKPGRIYMVPLPQGLHANSDELFGFFTYEIRVGHKRTSWSTAQGRYGRPLRVNGVQHPAPELVCSAFRRSKVEKLAPMFSEIVISAPFAAAVSNGKNVAAYPPQTSLWYLLYTQVVQADGKSYRNLLIESGHLPYQVKLDKATNRYLKADHVRLGSTMLNLKTIREKLKTLGLPTNSSLSVLAVEMFPLENEWQYNVYREKIHNDDELFVNEHARRTIANPLTDQLSKFRIYRSSALVSIADFCCDDC